MQWNLNRLVSMAMRLSGSFTMARSVRMRTIARSSIRRSSSRSTFAAASAARGYLFMGNAGMEEMSVEEWNRWREIFRRVREEEAPR